MSFDLAAKLEYPRGESVYSAPAGPNDIDYLLEYLQMHREQEDGKFPGSYTGEHGGFGLAKPPPNAFNVRSVAAERMGGIGVLPDYAIMSDGRGEFAPDGMPATDRFSSKSVHGGPLMVSRDFSGFTRMSGDPSKRMGSAVTGAPEYGDHIAGMVSGHPDYARINGEGLAEHFVVPMYDEFGVPRDATKEQSSFGMMDRFRDTATGADLMYRPKREHGPMFALESDIGINRGYLPGVFAREKFEDHARMTHKIMSSGEGELPAPTTWQGPGIGLSPDEIAPVRGTFDIYRAMPEDPSIRRSHKPFWDHEFAPSAPASKRRQLPVYGMREKRDRIELPALMPSGLSSYKRDPLKKKRPVAQRAINKGRELPVGHIGYGGTSSRPDFIGGPNKAYEFGKSKMTVTDLPPCIDIEATIRKSTGETAKKFIEYYRDSEDDVGAYIINLGDPSYYEGGGAGGDVREFKRGAGGSAGSSYVPYAKHAPKPGYTDPVAGTSFAGFCPPPAYEGDVPWPEEGSSRVAGTGSRVRSQRGMGTGHDGMIKSIKAPSVPIPDTERRAPNFEMEPLPGHGMRSSYADMREQKYERIGPKLLDVRYVTGRGGSKHSKPMYQNVKYDIALTKRDLVVAKDYIPGISGPTAPDSRMAARNARTSSVREEVMKAPAPFRRGPNVPVGPNFAEYSRTRLSIERPEIMSTPSSRMAFTTEGFGAHRFDEEREIEGYHTGIFRGAARQLRFLEHGTHRHNTRDRDFVSEFQPAYRP